MKIKFNLKIKTLNEKEDFGKIKFFNIEINNLK